MSCEQACCLLIRGKVYVQEQGKLPRLVGNSSRLSVTHVLNDITPLDGSSPACDPIDGVTVSISIKCADIENLRLGLHGQNTSLSQSNVTETFNLPDILNPGDLLPFANIAEESSVVVEHDWLNTANGQKFRKGTEYAVTEVGIEILRCVTVPTISPSNKIITVKYKTLDMTRTDAGQEQLSDLKLIYNGSNAFDGTPAVIVIPQVRFNPLENIDLINDSEIEISITGDVIRQDTSPNWYSLTRPSSGC